MEPRRQKAAADHERPGFSDTAASEVRKPFVMDRFHFKQDYIGYLDHRATHFYLLDIDTKT